MRNGEKQSFSAAVKNELVRLPLGKNCCMLSELSALTQTSGHLSFRGRGKMSVTYRLDNTGVARRLFLLLKKRLTVNPTLHFTQTSQLGGRRTCVLTLDEEDTRKLLEALHMIETDSEGQIHLRRTAPRHPMTRRCCRRAFLRASFLGSGTMADPERSYHLEWRADDEHLAEVLEKLLEKCDMTGKTYMRKQRQVVYLKGAQQISDMLALMGASHSVLDTESIRVRKQIRTSAVRAVNCDEHNGEKMLDASQKQMNDIRLISLKTGLFNLPPALQEMARLRIENPAVSLQELGQMMNPPIGKSGVNHRMRRLAEIAEKIKEDAEG